MRQRLAFLVLVAGVSFSPQHAQAQWQPNGVAISTALNDQSYPIIVSDGGGGAIVAWYDYRNGSSDIYAQRVDAAGIPQWAAEGVALCVVAGNQSPSGIVSDGAGGAIVTWDDMRSGTGSDIYTQWVDASGVPQWTADGVALCTAANNQYYPMIISDGAGGAIVTWEDYRSGFPNSDIYAQRVNASGAPQWTTDGIAFSTAAGNRRSPAIVSDGAGGAIVTWSDERSGASDIYAQQVNASGVPQWNVDGVALSTAANYQAYPTIVSDGAGGAIVTWQDGRSGYPNSASDIYAQYVSALGVPQWPADGVALCTVESSKGSRTSVSDGAGGAIVTWEDERGGTSDIYAQQVNASGTPQWTADGVAVCTEADFQQDPTIVSDGSGGAIVTWEDPRDGVQFDIYAQRVNAAGSPQWTANGVALCIAANDQRDPTIVSDGAGGAIVTWDDRRNGGYDIYAQHVPVSPNAVAIVSFDAVEVDGVVTLRSAFRSDLNVESVNVYRGVGNNDDPMRIIEHADAVRGGRFKYVDRDVAPGQTYRYQIGVVDADGEFFSPIATVAVNAVAGELSQNQPNPFNPTTTIRFTLPAREDVTLAIYDANGHLVRTLVNGVEGYGAHEVTWDGRDDAGATVGSGVYFYRLHAGKLTESKKMVLLK